MSDTRDPETDQAAPIPSERPSCHDLVAEDMEARKAHGLRKYDSLLQPNNGRSFTRDAYEEVLDLSVYLRGLLEEEAQNDDLLLGRVLRRIMADDYNHAALRGGNEVVIDGYIKVSDDERAAIERMLG